MNSFSKLNKLVGAKGVETLKSKNQTWKLSEEDLFKSALVIAQTSKLKSLLENCSKYAGSPYELDAKLDIEKKDNSWEGKLITKSSTLEIKKLDSDGLCSAVIALSGETVGNYSNQELVNEVKILANNYKPKNVSLMLKKSEFDCFVCKSRIELKEDAIKLCQCLEPLQAADIILTKSGERIKMEFSDNVDPSQLRFLIKLVTKQLLKDSK